MEVFRTAVALMIRSVAFSAQSAGQQRLLLPTERLRAASAPVDRYNQFEGHSPATAEGLPAVLEACARW